MKPATIPIDSIVVGNRRRTDMGDLDELANSIAEIGLIQPIVIDESFNLIAGGRRYFACKDVLKWTSIQVVLKETQGSELKLRRMELEENLKRKDMNWKERVVGLSEYHQLLVREKIMEGEKWALEETGKLLGVSLSTTAYCVKLASCLKDPNHPIQNAASVNDALRILLTEKENATNRLLVATSATPTVTPAAITMDDVLADIPSDNEPSPPAAETPAFSVCKACGGTGKSSSGDLCPICKGGAASQYSGDRGEIITIPLRKMLNWSKCEVFLPSLGDDAVDHVCTDPPYGIDMDYINQGDKAHIPDLDRTKKEHEVERNLATLNFAIPHFYRVIKPGGFCVLWYDNVYWQWLWDRCEKAGFEVQRWPLVWCKTDQCLNQCAHVNFTKSTEFVLVLRKGVANLRTVQNKNWMLNPNVDKHQFSHPFAKPPEVWEWLLKAIAAPGQTVLDPFMGSGSSIWTMARLGIRPLGCEEVEHWFNECFVTMQRAYTTWFAPRKVQFE